MLVQEDFLQENASGVVVCEWPPAGTPVPVADQPYGTCDLKISSLHVRWGK